MKTNNEFDREKFIQLVEELSPIKGLSGMHLNKLKDLRNMAKSNPNTDPKYLASLEILINARYRKTQ